MFSPSLRDELDALLLELRDRLRARPRRRRSSTFFANSWNSSFFETGSVSQPTATIVTALGALVVADEALARRAAGALAGEGHAALAQERPGGFEVAVRLLERALALHHPGAGGVAELLDEPGGDRRAH